MSIDSKATPQILEHLNKSLTVTIYETKWVCTVDMQAHLLIQSQITSLLLSTSSTQMDSRKCTLCCLGVICQEHRVHAGEQQG